MLNETTHFCITENEFNKDTAKHERQKTGLPIIYCNNTIPNIANEKFSDFLKCTINDYACLSLRMLIKSMLDNNCGFDINIKLYHKFIAKS